MIDDRTMQGPLKKVALFRNGAPAFYFNSWHNVSI